MWGRGVLAVVGALVLAACQSPREALEHRAAEYGREVQVLALESFPLLVVAPAQMPTANVLRVYLEGDGHAWVTPSQPSLDPTPRQTLVVDLAMQDPTPSLYMARPCQFVSVPGCTPALWTSRRFSPEVLDSLGQALDRLKARYGNQGFELVGYSGGGALALLLAGRREDVWQVQTLAGNLSPAEWARMLELTPLEGSLEPLQYRDRLARIPQRHLLGAEDRQVPADVAAFYARQLGEARCLELVSLPGVTHERGWQQAWPSWRQRSLACAPVERKD
ncbi:TPA: alpha/beta hydrolase [Pseudomonas putida]|uniref:alpha/beta hydrolase n=1 Tax=Pseudomonas putida TaxID=303 RepID=UPI000F7A6DAD|nr:alpha/beta hydrolase [Pseudomonas putida]RSC26609.1 alpha/beta hydrolase [Pseudomonas putida]HEK0906919.1 alpha/beta hydrolase [Pseudomonas putida]HEK1767963.1 alpha/beta hydrolase [Pseudomonas putida]